MTIHLSERGESQSGLGLETKGTRTLSLVLNFGTCLVSVSSRMKIFGTVSSQSRLVGLIFT